MNPVLLCIDCKTLHVSRYARKKSWYTKLTKLDEVQLVPPQTDETFVALESFRCGAIVSAQVAAREEPPSYAVPA